MIDNKHQSPSILAPDLNIKPSQLYVKDLQKVTKFYCDAVGLQVLESTDSRTILGQGEIPALELISKPEFKQAELRSAGLFHNAIVYSSRSELARAVLSVLEKASWSYEGSADHLVSEAFYFHDPENNGLELYYDKPREDWRWINGSVAMDSLYLDTRQYILTHIDNPVSDLSKKLGHVHLRVGDIATARKFYIEQLGFDITADMGSALFVSVGGYHHHMAMNTWHSAGASKRDPGLGLAEVKLILPNDGSIDRLANRLTHSELGHELKQGNIYVNDPWNNRLVFSVD